MTGNATRRFGSKALPALLVGLCASMQAAIAAEPSTPEAVTVITAASMIDGLGAKPRTHVAVVVRGDRIVAVRDGNAQDLPAGAQHIDLGAATLLPGLIDTHTHIFLQGEVPAEGGYDVQLLKQPQSFRAARAVVSARRALEQGFTTLRDMGTEGAGYGDVGIKQAIEAGYIPGPKTVRVHAGHIKHGRLSAGELRTRIDRSQRSAVDRRTGVGPPGRA